MLSTIYKNYYKQTVNCTTDIWPNLLSTISLQLFDYYGNHFISDLPNDL